MPDVCGTKKASVHESGGEGFTKVGFLLMRNGVCDVSHGQYI